MPELSPEQEALLLTWIDGEATEQEKVQAQDLVNCNPDAASFKQLLEQSDFPYAQASALQLEPAPEHLVNQILGDQPKNVVGESTNQFSSFALAASLLAGLVLGGLFSTQLLDSQNVEQQPVAQSPPDWVQSIASYHALYVRETVSPLVSQPLASAAETMRELLQTDSQVPDLSSRGLVFKRIQQLAIDEKPLVQLVYLPEVDKPVAVCVLRLADSATQPPVFSTSHDLQVAWWQTDGYGVTVLGDFDKQTLQQVTSDIRETLFSSI